MNGPDSHAQGSAGHASLMESLVTTGVADDNNVWRARSRLLTYLVLSISLLGWFYYLSGKVAAMGGAWYIAIDAAGVAVGLAISALCATYYLSFGPRSLLFLAIGFAGSSIISGVHLIQTMGAYSHLIPGSFPADGWISMAAHLFLGILVLAGWRAAKGQISVVSPTALGAGWVFALGALLLMIILTGSFLLAALPASSLNRGLLNSLEVLISILFVAALIIFLHKGDWRHYPLQHWFVLFLIFEALSHAPLMPESFNGAQSILLAKHAAGLVAYLFAFTALISCTSNLFNQASSHQLSDRINQLIGRHLGPATMQGSGTGISGVDLQVNTCGMFELDIASGRLKGNQAAMQLLGNDHTLEHITDLRRILHPDDRLRLIDALYRSDEEGTLFKQQFRVAGSDGYRWLEGVAGIEYRFAGSSRLIGYIDDITSRKNLELEKERLYRDLNQMTEAVDQHAATATLDFMGNIRSVNVLFCEFCGVSEDKLRGQKFTGLLSTMSDSKEPQADWTAAHFRQTRWKGRLSCSRPDGAYRIAFGSITPHLDDRGQFDTFIYLGFDLAPRGADDQVLRTGFSPPG